MNSTLFTSLILSTSAFLILTTCGKDSPTKPTTVQPVPARINIVPSSLTLDDIGKTGQLTATVLDGNNRPVTGVSIVWSSSATLVATVDSRGLVRAIGAGTARITAAAGSVRAQVVVTVEGRPMPTTVIVRPSTASFEVVGATLQLTAEVRDQRNQIMTDVDVSWSSGDAAVASVDTTGLITARGQGMVRIYATASTVTGSMVITVMQQIQTITLTPATATLAPGDTLRVIALARDTQGAEINDPLFNWSSDDESVATVDSDGLVLAIGAGNARITAAAGNVRAQVVVTVAVGDNLERKVLVALYNATDGPNWQNNEHWLSNDPLGNWAGVQTDPHTGRVTNLNLIANNLKGRIPPELGDLDGLKTLKLRNNRLIGRIPGELGNLDDLEILELNTNELSGMIPSELGKLFILETLDLSQNELTGKIPAELGKLGNLKILNLSDNELSGMIPAELGRLHKLESLRLIFNKLTGKIPAELGNLGNLEMLDLRENELSGQIPAELGRLTNLKTIDLSYNGLADEIPQELGSMIRLQSMILNDNRVTGSIPPTFGRLDDLQILNLSDNLISGEIPPELGGMGELRTLDLSGNRVTGSIPATFGRLYNLQILDMSGNLISGEIPPELGDLTNLGILSLMYNLISGPIPPDLAELVNLQELSLHENRLSGEIPNELSGMTRVRILSLYGNQLTGKIPAGLGDLSSLETLDLSQNELSGGIPPELGNLDGLQALHLNNNNLQEAIPPELGNLDGLLVLDLDENDLEDTIPPELGNLRGLQRLDLTRNSLTGGITPELGNLSNLRLLFLGGNQLSGEIPPDLGRLSSLEQLFLWDSQLTGSIPPELGELRNLEWLAVENNELTGNLPPELGLLENLSSLNLRKNRFTGSIPPELGNLKSLRSLILIGNDFTGELPAEMIKLDLLIHFLAYRTQLCLPTDAVFQQWIHRFPDVGLPDCETTIHAVRIVPDSVRVDAGETVQLSAAITDAEGRNVPDVSVIWASDDNTIASVDMEGLVTAHMNGTTTIRASSERVSAQARLTVGVPSVPTRLEITLDELVFHAVGANKLLKVLVYDQHGRIMEDASVSWWSDDPEVATVDSDGRVTSAGEGMTRVTAKSGVATVTLSVMVAQKIHSISLTPVSAVLSPGDTLNIEAKVLDLRKTPIALAHLDWTTGDDSVATVDAEGLVRAAGAGSTEITASAADVSKSAMITVMDDIDREVLVALYNATNGPAWKENAGWLSDEPLHKWSNVEIDDETGRVTRLFLSGNGLSGRIPPELGSMEGLVYLSLSNNQLYGEIPHELGSLKNLINLNVARNELSGEIPPELGNLTNLEQLVLFSNQLRGSLPSSLGDLSSLVEFLISYNDLTGDLPPTLGKLSNLERMSFIHNGFTGKIPDAFGNLSNLRQIFLNSNSLSGMLPTALGNLANLELLSITDNMFTGEIPPDLGRLINLRILHLDGNQLTGTIPPELNDLRSLEELNLSYNGLSGSVPSELGSLSQLRELILHNNELTGEIPSEFGSLSNLERLELFYNELTGDLPQELTALSNLDEFYLSGTEVCAPSDPVMRDWIEQLERSSIANCEAAFRTGEVVAYLTQAVQSPTNPVPLVAGEPALLRVFLTSDRESDMPLPPVRAMFYHNGSLAHTENIPGQEIRTHSVIYEGSLSESVNTPVPASIVAPGLEMVIEIDPESTLNPEAGTGMRIPESGRIEVKVAEVPDFNLTVVPFLWERDPDFQVVEETEGLTADHELFRQLRYNLPVADFNLTIHDPVWTSIDPSVSNTQYLLLNTELIQTIEGQPGYYMGTITGRWGGQAWLGGTVSVSPLSGSLIAHELGHNMNLKHAPCGSAPFPDLHFPDRGGSISAWGYDHVTDSLIPPDTPDLMGYCGHPDDTWISDYSFTRALNHRQYEEPRFLAAASSSTRNLVLWGGVDEGGSLFLEPAFAVDAPPSLPEIPGPYLLTGEDSVGNTLFDLSFDTGKISHAPGVSFFTFALPVDPEWSEELVKITLSGPRGIVTIGREGDVAASLLMDPATGQVRGILRDIPAQNPSRLSARRVLPEAGLDTVISRGIPASTDW